MEGNRFRGRGGKTPPVSVGEELDVTIEAVGEKGDGIAKKNGFVLFVPGVKEGERIRVKVTKVLSKVGFAEKVGEAETAAEPERPQQPTDEEAEEALEAPRYEHSSYEDTEDFGEEPAEEFTDEVTEEVEEEPAEEVTEEDDEENQQE